MTNPIEREDPSEDLGGEPFVMPGEEAGQGKLPNPRTAPGATRGAATPGQNDPGAELCNPDPTSDKLTIAWENYMVNGFAQTRRCSSEPSKPS